MISVPQHRNLKELLREQQEPFHKQNSNQNASFSSSFRRNACFCSSSSSSPDPFTKSPLLSPAAHRNPPDALFLHVPPKTAALLLEAALRVHTNSNPKPRIRSFSFGLLNSLIKRLRIRTRIPKTGDDGVVRWSASAKTSETSSNTSTFSSSSCSSSFCSTTTTNGTATELEEEEQIRCVMVLGREDTSNNGGIGHQDGDFPSLTSKENASYERKLQSPPMKSSVEEDEEDKEQKSPVSILDPPFEDDDCEDEKCRTEDDRFDMESSYTFSQRAKRRVLLKFEELIELDPTKLQDKTEDDDFLVKVCCQSGLMIEDLRRPWMKRLLSDVISEEKCINNCKTSLYGDVNYNELMAKKVSKRFESWREVEANTIDMMIDIDFRGESDKKWKKQAEDDDISCAATEIEFSIFSGLLQDLLHEFVST